MQLWHQFFSYFLLTRSSCCGISTACILQVLPKFQHKKQLFGINTSYLVLKSNWPWKMTTSKRGFVFEVIQDLLKRMVLKHIVSSLVWYSQVWSSRFFGHGQKWKQKVDFIDLYFKLYCISNILLTYIFQKGAFLTDSIVSDAISDHT